MSDSSEGEDDARSQADAADLSQLFIRDGRPLKFALHASIRNRGAQEALVRDIEEHGGVFLDNDDGADIVLVKRGPGCDKYTVQAAYGAHSNPEKRKIWVHELGFVRECIQIRRVHQAPRPKQRMPGHPAGRGRTAFSESDDEHLCDYLANVTPDAASGGRLGHELYRSLVAYYAILPDEYQWVLRHSHQSWRNRYKKNRGRMDRRIQELADQREYDLKNTYHRDARLNKYPGRQVKRKLVVSDEEDEGEEDEDEEEEQEEPGPPVHEDPARPAKNTSQPQASVSRDKGKQKAVEPEPEEGQSENERPSSLFSADDDEDDPERSTLPEWGDVHKTVFAPQRVSNAGPSGTARSKTSQHLLHLETKSVVAARTQPRSPDRTLVNNDSPGRSRATTKQKRSSASNAPNTSNIIPSEDVDLNFNSHHVDDFTLSPNAAPSLPPDLDLPQIEHLVPEPSGASENEDDFMPPEKSPSPLPPPAPIPSASPKRKRKKAKQPQAVQEPVDFTSPYRNTRSRSRSVEPPQLPPVTKTKKKRGPKTVHNPAVQVLHPLPEAEEMQEVNEEQNVQDILVRLSNRSLSESNANEGGNVDQFMPDAYEDQVQHEEPMDVVVEPEDTRTERTKSSLGKRRIPQQMETDDEQGREFLVRASAKEEVRPTRLRTVDVAQIALSALVPKLSKGRARQVQEQPVLPSTRSSRDRHAASLANAASSSRVRAAGGGSRPAEDVKRAALERGRANPGQDNRVPIPLIDFSARPRKASPKKEPKMRSQGSVSSADFPIKGTHASAKKMALLEEEKSRPFTPYKSTKAARAVRSRG